VERLKDKVAQLSARGPGFSEQVRAGALRARLEAGAVGCALLETSTFLLDTGTMIDLHVSS
jgi:hypothetical protein